ncbi:DUF3500 domain-containing protein [Lewinella sp. LCG006]|uniref:DUF3500 domain-containing protein n=1 Tax=Lewinella sp. LCG006 TaxID=3231911 RepID=UPI003460A117
MKVNVLPSGIITAIQRVALLLLVCLALIACENDKPEAAADEAFATKLFAEEVARAANHLIEVTPEAKRDLLRFRFDDEARTMGKVTSETPSFCAVLAWCLPGWGIQQSDMSHEQLVAMHQLLNLALSPGGYQTLLAVQNRQRIIGEMEDVSDILAIKNATDHHHDHPHQPVQSIFDLDSVRAASGFYPALGGAFLKGDSVTVDWVWPAPGLQTRRDQFDMYTIAIFGEPSSDQEWGFRFEGHHLTVNMTFVPDPKTGEIQVHTTPLFFGAFPMIIPEAPEAPDAEAAVLSEWNWEEGQLMMYSVAHHLRQFWLAVPENLRNQAFISADHFPQAGPLVIDTALPWLISAVEPRVDTAKIADYPHINITTDELSPEALWHLKQAYEFYTNSMNNNVSAAYRSRIEAALAPGQPLTLSWAGKSLENVGSNHYSYLVVGALLLEFMQNNQFTVQHDPDVTGNHVHSMLRDLSFDWLDPMDVHRRFSHAN